MSFDLLQTATTTSSQSSIVLSDIPQTYKDLQLMVMAKNSSTTPSTRVGLLIAFNGDSTNANYIFNQFYMQDAASGQVVDDGGTYARWIGVQSWSAAGYPANNFGFTRININNYTNNDRWSIAYGPTGQAASGSILDNWGDSVTWENTAAITSITLTPNTGNFVDGSTCQLYGLK